MNRKVLKLSALVLAAMSIAAFAGCQKNDSASTSGGSSSSSIAEEEKTFDQALVGSWERTIGQTRITYTFSADSTLDVMKEELDHPYGDGHYQTTGDQHKCFTVGNELHYEREPGDVVENVHTYTISGDELIINSSTGGKDMVYTRKTAE